MMYYDKQRTLRFLCLKKFAVDLMMYYDKQRTLRFFCLGKFTVNLMMYYDKQRTLRFLCLKKFVVNLIMQRLIMMTATMTMNGGHSSDGRLDPTTPVMMCAYAVGGLHWPFAKDYPIVCVGQSTFAFAMSGLLYGLQFPLRCKPHLIDILVRVSIKFGNYIDLKQHELISNWIFLFFNLFIFY